MGARGFLVVLALAADACEDDDGGDDGHGDTSEECADAPGYDDVEIFATCTMCHSSTLTGADRNGALATVNFDTYAAAMTSASRGLERVEAGAMPPPSSGLSVSAQESEQLEQWILCGTPE